MDAALHLIDFAVSSPEEDPARPGLELVHDACGKVVAGITDEDSLYGLVRNANLHVCPAQPHWHVRRHAEDWDSLAVRFYSPFAALQYAAEVLQAHADAALRDADTAHRAAHAARAAEPPDPDGELAHYRQASAALATEKKFGTLAQRARQGARTPPPAVADALDLIANINSTVNNPDHFRIWPATDQCACNPARTDPTDPTDDDDGTDDGTDGAQHPEGSTT
jgi:hypothetical protein